MITNAVLLAACQELEDKEGRLTPLSLVRAAKDPTHPLHGAFDWDDAKAGHAWRIEQARGLLVRVRMITEEREEQVSVIAYVRDPSKVFDEQGYRSTVKIADEKEQARAVVATELVRVLGCLGRASEVAFAVGVSADLLDITIYIKKLLKRLAPKRAA